MKGISNMFFRDKTLPAWECCTSGKYNIEALERIRNGIEYTEADFEGSGSWQLLSLT